MRKKVFPRILLTLLWVSLLTSSSFAQTKTITGIISDQAGLPLERATVKVKGEKISSITDASGRFRISAPSDSKTLVVS